MPQDRLDEFVRAQAKVAEAARVSFDPEKEKALWLAKLEELYGLTKESVGEYIGDGTVRLDFSDVEISEESLGRYRAREAHLYVGRQLVKLTPIGTFLIGSRGRVDMTGPKGIVRLLLVPPKATRPEVRINVIVPGSPRQAPAPAQPGPPPEEWVWKIATQPPRITFIDLTKESFRDALAGVVNG